MYSVVESCLLCVVLQGKVHPDYAFRRREIGRVLAMCPNQCGFEGKVEEAVVRK